MAVKNFAFQGHFVGSKVESQSNTYLFANLALDILLQVFGYGKGTNFEVARFMVPAILEKDLKKIKKAFLVAQILFGGKKKNSKKNKPKLKPFFDNTSSFKDFNFKDSDLSSDTVLPNAFKPDISPNRLEKLKEQNRRLKQDLETK